MIFEQFFDKNSSTFTYLISSGPGREAIIIDPVLEHVENYLSVLNKLNLKLVKVLDTNIHADHITGMSELKDKTNCQTVMGDKTPAEIVSIKVKDQELINLEKINIKAIYTPGHTYESFSFLTDVNDFMDVVENTVSKIRLKLSSASKSVRRSPV